MAPENAWYIRSESNARFGNPVEANHSAPLCLQTLFLLDQPSNINRRAPLAASNLVPSNLDGREISTNVVSHHYVELETTVLNQVQILQCE